MDELVPATLVYLPPAVLDECNRRARSVADQAERQGSRNYEGQTGGEWLRFYKGFLGEAAIYRWLAREGIPYLYEICYELKSGGPDVIVGRYKIEVKAVASPRFTHMTIGEARKYEAAVYIAARSRDTAGPGPRWEVMGWLKRAEVLAYPANGERYKSPVRMIPLVDMHAPSTLLPFLAREGHATWPGGTKTLPPGVPRSPPPF